MTIIPNKLREINDLKVYEETEEYYIYFLCTSDEVVYIGRTDSLAPRLREHRKNNKIFEKCYYITTFDKNACIKQEKELILTIKPKYNIQNLYDRVYLQGLKKGKYKNRIDIALLKRKIQEEDLSIPLLAKKADVFPGSIYYLLSKGSGSRLIVRKIAKVLKIKMKDLKQTDSNQ